MHESSEQNNKISHCISHGIYFGTLPMYYSPLPMEDFLGLSGCGPSATSEAVTTMDALFIPENSVINFHTALSCVFNQLKRNNH